MWKRRPDSELIERWIERALSLSEPETPARARALIARTCWDPESFGAEAVEASELAERLGHIELRSWALEARARAEASRGDYHEQLALIRRRFDLIPQLTDPDHIAWIYTSHRWACLSTGRIEEARRAAHTSDELTNRLSAHHRVHGVSALIDVERCSGQWETVRDLTARAEPAVAANLATPCVLNAWSLLACALAHTRQGNEQEARRLEQSAEDLGMEGFSLMLDPIHIELAIAGGELSEVERKLSEWSPGGLGDVDGLVARLNALVVLERRAEIEGEAPALLKSETYLEAFALRALGFARGDDGLIEQAIKRFEAMGLDWHAAQTRKLVAQA